MPSLSSLRSRLAIAATIAIALGVLVALPSLVRPGTASAQSPFGNGYTGNPYLGNTGNGYTGNPYLGNGNIGNAYTGNAYTGYNSGYSGSGCQQVLFSSSGCVQGSSSYGGSTYGGTSSRSCAGINLSAGQTCSNGVVSCAAGTTSCANGGYGITSCPPKLTTPQCTGTTTPAPAQTIASAVLPSSGATTCPGGGFASSLASCGSASAGTAGNASAGVTAAAQPGFSLSLASGWNLLAGPDGTTLPGMGLLTFLAGDTSYETLSAGTPFKAGVGYWAFIPIGMQVTLAAATGGSTTVQLPAGQPVMIGNPGNTPATVTGADQVFIYNSSTSSYSSDTQLQPGQGAWALSNGGGQATITNGPPGQAALAGAAGS